MLRCLKIIAGLLLLAVVTAYETGAQQTASPLNLGTLRCTIAPGVAVIVDSPREMRCTFYKSDGIQEAYRGEVRGGGLSIGITGRSFAAWAVTSDPALARETSLSGRYSGVETGVTVGVGATSRALSNLGKAVSLQPLDVGPQAGLNFALGISQMDLYALGTPQLPPTAEPTPLVPERTYPAPVPQPPEAAPPPPQIPDYACAEDTRLQPSQTLYGLARACRVSLAILLEANPQITNVRTIQAGALIRIPQQRRRTTGRCGSRTLVKRGETLADVASRCGVSVDALASANPDLARDSAIPGGQVLSVPPPGEAPEPAEIAEAAPVEAAKQPAALAETPDADQPEQTEVVPPPAAEAPLPPALPEQEIREAEQLQQQETDGEFALLQDRCRQAASKQYGLLVDQITVTSTIETDDNRYSVALNVGSSVVTCLVDPQGEVLSLTNNRDPAEQANVDPKMYEAIRARLPDDEALFMIALSDKTETLQTGRIEGYRSTAYGLQARANETLEITFDANNTNAYFNVVSADMPYGEALFVGIQESRNRAVIRIPEDGMYLVRPYLALASARQNETASYTLRISRTAPLTAPPPGKADRKNFAPSGKSDRLVPLN